MLDQPDSVSLKHNASTLLLEGRQKAHELIQYLEVIFRNIRVN